MSQVATCLWFDKQAEEAARFYVSLLPGSTIDFVLPFPAETPSGGPGGVMTVEFTLAGQHYIALNGGPYFHLSPAVSISVTCEDQAEVDRLWEALLEGGAPQQCGWLTDRFGLSWQIVPKRLLELVKDKDAEKARRVTEAMLQMVKLDVRALEQAAA
ncbi:VOC family protein [Agaricicola taiwanensis]|uniref:VOC family protein n=1 Tax=Agaricicola taiwanensis TaxID=591372 RepID=A0A8J2VM95_9RHOB|nr:VOC family protein [Agaricicola taiwanensis]GGE32872.1 VOC family protein [Agaricicola taiwanensis]